MTKKLIFIFCGVPFFVFAQLSDFQTSMLNSVDSLIILTTNNTSTITTISSDSTYIISLAETISPDDPYYQTAGHIIDLANHIDSMSSYLSGVNAQRYQNLIGLRETISNMSFANDDIGNITNQLNYVCSRLDDIYTLFYNQHISTYLYNIQADLDLIQTYTYSIDSDVGTIKTTLSQISSYASSMVSDVRSIESKLDTLITDVFGIRYTLNRLYNNFTSYLDSWHSHSDHQDNFYSSATNQLNQIIASLANLNISNNNSSLDIDYSAITGIITNFPSSYLEDLGIASENLRITDYRYWSPNMTASGTFNNRYFYNTSLGDNLVRGSYYYILDDPENYNPFIIQLMLSLYNSSALTSLNNWQYLLHTNLVDLVQSSGVISGTLRNIDSSVRDISVSISTNNVILGQQLSRLDYIQSLFSNNVPVATLNHASWDWHMFFTNFYMYVSLGPENYNITNVGVSSTWHDNTNWFNRIEALLAALVFKDDNSGRVNTNVVSTSAIESAVSDVTTSLRSVVEIDNSFSQNVSSSASTIIDMLTEWTQQITSSAQLQGSFDMFNVPHMDSDDSQVHPQDSPASGDWAFRIGVQDTDFGDFIHFLRSLTTVLWLCVFMFFALKMSLFLLICICKFVYFCYVVFSAMMGGD